MLLAPPPANGDHAWPFHTARRAAGWLPAVVNWPAAMTAVQKIGYDQTLLFEVVSHGSPKETLVRTQRARENLERLLAD